MQIQNRHLYLQPYPTRSFAKKEEKQKQKDKKEKEKEEVHLQFEGKDLDTVKTDYKTDLEVN